MIFLVFSRAASSTMRWLSTESLARAEESSLVARACRARSCQPMALSVRHCSASPSGSRTASFCRDTSRDRMVSRRGRRERWHNGHRNLHSLLPDTSFFCEPALGTGTQAPWNQSRHSSHCSMKPLAVLRHRQNFTSSMCSTRAILARLAARSEWMATSSCCSRALKAATTAAGSRVSSRTLRASSSRPCSFSSSSFTRLRLLLLVPYTPMSTRGLSTWRDQPQVSKDEHHRVTQQLTSPTSRYLFLI